MELLAEQLGRYGLMLVFLVVFLEQAGAPIPAAPVLVLGGALAARGEQSALLVLATAVLASLIADAAWFALGRRHGRRLLRKICFISLSPESCVRQTERLFYRFGVSSIVVAKLIPGFSTLAPPLAGAMGVGTARFMVMAAVAAFVWAGGAIAFGWVFHSTIEQMANWLASLGSWGLLLVGALLAGFIGYKWWQRHRFYRLLQMSRIKAGELQSLLEGSNEVMVFDVRTEGGRQVDPRRIPGALVLYTEDPDEFEAQIANLPRDRDIVLYCT